MEKTEEPDIPKRLAEDKPFREGYHQGWERGYKAGKGEKTEDIPLEKREDTIRASREPGSLHNSKDMGVDKDGRRY